MNDLLVHRGPDDEGVFVDGELSVALGARRLSIIDLENGHQPLTNESGSVVGVLNGEIYNYRALRKNLLAAGHTFRTHTDTEVLVHLYEDFGDALVHTLEGMFAFAILDRTERRLLLARDRFGEKPLFYVVGDGALAFASELTALAAGSRLAPQLSANAIDSYFILGYVPGPETMLTPHRQVEPGELVSWSLDQRELRHERYWRPLAYSSSSKPDWPDVIDEAQQLLHDSVRSRLVADVPVGVLLSGGVDSTLVAAIASQHVTQPLKTFTVAYDVGSFGEEDAASRSARLVGADHNCFVLESRDVADLATSVLGSLDQPLADEALLAMHAIAKVARAQVKVVVGGEGADEVFAGYPRYRWLPRVERLSTQRLPRAAASALMVGASNSVSRSRMARLARSIRTTEPAARYLDWIAGRRLHVRDRVYGPALEEVRDRSPLATANVRADALVTMDGLMQLDQQMWLPDDVLTKADRATMLASLEMRTPYLHRGLVEFAASLPAAEHASRGGGKRVLREILHRELPDAAVQRRKVAFRVPMASWLRTPGLRLMLHDQITCGSLVRNGYLNSEFLLSLEQRHHSRGEDWSDVLWSVLVLGTWADRVVGR